jgi:hydrogenase maturation protease
MGERLRRTAIVGVGNMLLRDEGIGVHLAQELSAKMPSDSEVQIIDGGTCPDIFPSLGGVEHLIIVDAVKAGGEPGTIYRFMPEEITNMGNALASAHHIDLIEGLTMMHLLGMKPRRTVIIGVEPQEIGWGLELSPSLQKVLPRLVNVVLQEISGHKESTTSEQRKE